MNEKFDYEYIKIEIKKIIDSGLIPENDINLVTNWYNGMSSDVSELVDFNAKLLMKYLKKNKISRTNEDATNYKEICSDIFIFLDTNKNLDEQIVEKLKSYMSILGDESVNNEKKYKISENFYNIRLNVKYKEKSIELLEIIDKKYKDNIEYANKLYALIEILLDEDKPLIEREKAELDIDDILKYEKELAALQHSSK